MCYTGAKSETANQLKELLNLTNMSNDDILKLNNELVTCINTRLGKDVVLSTANKIYPNKGFELQKDFVETITKHFQGEVEQVDYSNPAESSKTINDWVLAKTNNKIKDLIPPMSIDSLLRLIVVNAVYFKGTWANKFQPSLTIQEDFH